jgi:hypothetical protein
MTPNPQPAAEPLPSQGAVPANLMADLFPGSGEPLPPSTQTPPSSDVFGIDISPAPVMPDAPPAPEASAVSGLSLEDFVSKHIADPDTLFQGDGRKISQFRELRGLFEGATRDLAAAHLELSQLRQSQVAAPVSNGAPLPETEAIQKLTAEIEVLRKWLADPGLFARDPGGFNKRSALLVEKEAALAAAEEEWLRLELLREEAEGAPAA